MAHRGPNMLRQIILFSLLALTLSLPQHLPFVHRARFCVRKPPCGAKCQFRFCVDRTSVLVSSLEYLGGSTICRKSQDIDGILETGEALVSLESGRNVPISEWRPDGLDTPFSPDIFSTITLPGGENSNIRISEREGNQNKYLADRCLILPIKRYEVVRFKNRRRIVRPKAARRPDQDCVAFEPRPHDIIFEVRWSSGDDLDLSVIEPDGTLLDFNSRTSKCGRSTDSGTDCQENSENRNEFVIYSWDCEGFQHGTYTVLLHHRTNCLLTDPPEPTEFELYVSIDGINRLQIPGSSNKNNGELIRSFTYRI